MRLSFLLVLTSVALGTACARRPQAPPSRATAKPCDDCLPGVENFGRISPALWRGAQPTAEGFRSLEAAGVRTIVSLRHDHDDAPLMQGTQLKLVRIPARAWHPEEEDMVRFLEVLQDPANWPVYVHCAQGRDRTGYAVATYRVVVQDWSADDALHEMFDFHFNTAWFYNPIFIRKVREQGLGQPKVALHAPAP